MYNDGSESIISTISIYIEEYKAPVNVTASIQENDIYNLGSTYI